MKILEKEQEMKSGKTWLLIAGVIAGSFVGGAVSRWLLPFERSARAGETTEAPKIITAQKFQVVNEVGKTVAAFGITSNGPAALNLTDENTERPHGRRSVERLR
ncbi:MAG: hypothetical protein HZA50_19155 [Planctomycetes bacterium]|nr:hypothetical protein [Planctomycetota bacterium]